MTKFKIQYSTYEKGEFTEENQLSLKQALDIVNENTKPIKFKNSSSIKKQGIKFYFQNGENYLKAEHFGKNAFHVYYCNDPDKVLYQGNYYLPKLIKLITLFYKGDFNELNRILPKTLNHEKKLIKTFVAEDFVYSKKSIGLFNIIIWSILPLFFFSSFLLLKLSEHTLISLIFGLTFSTPILLIIRIHNNYQKATNINAIKISTGINEITVWENSKEYSFKKTDIKELLIFNSNLYRNPFDAYTYTHFILISGKEIIITSMVIDAIEMEYKVWNIPHQVIKKGYPYIK